MKLDAEMHPSIEYLLGWREHRYRYYYYYPEFTPDFSLLDKKDEDEGEKAMKSDKERPGIPTEAKVPKKEDAEDEE